ncbi:MAG: hypothetical protein OYL97_11235 [Candidatus Poribacteria bacterium]|nr:hypothetical protein [Candidatus Poribacteria bacterium]
MFLFSAVFAPITTDEEPPPAAAEPPPRLDETGNTPDAAEQQEPDSNPATSTGNGVVASGNAGAIEVTAPILSRLEVRGESRQSVFVGKRIATPLVVPVLDTDNAPVADVRVTFTVVSDSMGTERPLTRYVQSNA